MAQDYTILHAPRISKATFAKVLRNAGSPAAPYANRIYDEFVKKGVDPAFALAVYRKESSYGKAGVARWTKGWGNLRTSPNYPSKSGFAYYPNYIVGAADTARLMRIYGLNQIRPGKKTSTALTFAYVWAPAADNNAPAAYGPQVVKFINEYIKTGGGTPNPINTTVSDPKETTPAKDDIQSAIEKVLKNLGISTSASHKFTIGEAKLIAGHFYGPFGANYEGVYGDFVGWTIKDLVSFAKQNPNVTAEGLGEDHSKDDGLFGIAGAINDATTQIGDTFTWLGFILLGVVLIIGGIILLRPSGKEE